MNYNTLFLYKSIGTHRGLHVQTHSFPTLRTSDLKRRWTRFSSSLPIPSRTRRHLLFVLLFLPARPPSPASRQVAPAFGVLLMAAPTKLLSICFVKSGPSTRSEEHTSELQSLMRITYAVFCLKK